ncbi:MAG: hypothetical protein AAFU49_09640 [Pseudomonadota bacterium]
MPPRTISFFSAALVLVLLALYAGLAGGMILEIYQSCSKDPTGSREEIGGFSEGYKIVLTTVAGLVSALVVAKLSVSTTNDPQELSVIQFKTRAARIMNNAIVVVYLAVWAVVGLAALIFGVVLYDRAIQTINDLGTTWLGVAVAAGYAYFNLKPAQP